jgi:hypothetical protein
MGARFLGVALVASIVWYALHWHKYSLARAGARILIFAFVAAILGKVVGIVTYRLRTRRLRDVVSAITRRSLPSRRLKVTREDGGEPHQPDYAGAYSDATRG